jgi:hypothetical protein
LSLFEPETSQSSSPPLISTPSHSLFTTTTMSKMTHHHRFPCSPHLCLPREPLMIASTSNSPCAPDLRPASSYHNQQKSEERRKIIVVSLFGRGPPPHPSHMPVGFEFVPRSSRRGHSRRMDSPSLIAGTFHWTSSPQC